MKADLHLHTIHSDGVRTSFEVLDLAVSFGIEVAALSDHDNLAAYFEGREYAATKGIRLVPAVELSTNWQGEDIHILAYDFDPASDAITERLEFFRHRRENRGALMVERLIELGHPITLERVQELCGGGSLGRPHLARALVECGSVASIDAAFDELLSPGKPGYVDVARIGSEEAIALIHRAGGFASIAHAAVYGDGDGVIDALIGAGLDGIEVFHPDVDAEHADRYLALAARHRLLVTGGSDYHGFEGSRHIGEVMLPEPYTARFVERLRS